MVGSGLACGLDRRGARRESAGARRRAAILAAATEMLDERPFGTITMALVAERSGVVKGALYTYFPTRETLFLAVLVDDLDAWFDDLQQRLGGSTLVRPDGVAVLLAASLDRRARMARLLALLSGAIAQGVDPGVMRAFAAHVAERDARAAAMLAVRAPGLDGVRLLRRARALAIGLGEVGDAASGEFAADLAETLTALVRAEESSLASAR